MWGTIFVIFIVLLSASIIGFKVYTFEKLKKEPTVTLNLEKIEAFFAEIDNIKQDYFTKPAEDKVRENYQGVFDFFSKLPYAKLKLPRLEEFKNTFKNLTDSVKEWNAQYVESELVKHKELFDSIDGKALDNQQRLTSCFFSM